MLATVARRTTRFVRLRSLRSDKCDKSDDKARCARPRPLRFSAPHTARCGLPTHALAEMVWTRYPWNTKSPLRCNQRFRLGVMNTTSLLAAAGAARWGRCSGVAVTARLGQGAQVLASLTDSRPLFEQREHSERREFGRAGPTRADKAQSAQATTPDEPPPGGACRSTRGVATAMIPRITQTAAWPPAASHSTQPPNVRPRRH